MIKLYNDNLYNILPIISTNRQFICIELDKNYFDIAKKRIEETEYNDEINITTQYKGI